MPLALLAGPLGGGVSLTLREMSLSEAGALAFKAARGAGMEWGLAEEARVSVTWVNSHGLPGLPALLSVLEAGLKPMQGTVNGPADVVCLSVLHAGAALSDHGRIPAEGLHLPAVVGSLLMVPFVAHLSGVYSIEWRTHDASAQVTVRGGSEPCLWCAGSPATHGAARLSIMPLVDAPAGAPIASSTRAFVHIDHLKRLEAFAAATYAPATEASRARGAGGAD